MQFHKVTLCLCLPFLSVIGGASWRMSPAIATEQTLLLCEGSVRTTARIYQNEESLMMRLYDRQNQSVWFHSQARDETNPEAFTYSNIRGEATYRVSRFRASDSECSIQLGNQPLEQGVVKD